MYLLLIIYFDLCSVVLQKIYDLKGYDVAYILVALNK
jgi:hypothetical protein